MRLFADSLGSHESHQGTNVVAYQFGLVPDEDRESVLDFIVEAGFDCSTLLSLNLLQVLFNNGKCREAYNLLNRTQEPGWGYMISKGYKTIWEGFRDIESRSHAWNAYPARIFAEYLAGIKATAPGFKEVIIKPYIPEGLQFVEGKVPTVLGDVYAGWEKTEGGFTLKVTVPYDSMAKICVPKPGKGIGIISKSGEIIWKNAEATELQSDIRYCGEDNEYIIFEAGEGQHVFDVT